MAVAWPTDFEFNPDCPQSQGLLAWWPMVGEYRFADRLRQLAPTEVEDGLITTDGGVARSHLHGNEVLDFNLSYYTAQMATTPSEYSVCVRAVKPPVASHFCWGFGDATADEGPHFGFNVGGANTWRIAHWATGGFVNQDHGSVGTPYDMVVTYDGTTIRLYADGVEIGNDGTTSLGAPTSHKFFIGAHTAESDLWTGELWDMRFYNFGLTPAQVMDYTTNPLGMIRPQYVNAAWKAPAVAGDTAQPASIMLGV
jgi:hypothetical protein